MCRISIHNGVSDLQVKVVAKRFRHFMLTGTACGVMSETFKDSRACAKGVVNCYVQPHYSISTDLIAEFSTEVKITSTRIRTINHFN